MNDISIQTLEDVIEDIHDIRERIEDPILRELLDNLYKKVRHIQSCQLAHITTIIEEQDKLLRSL